MTHGEVYSWQSRFGGNEADAFFNVKKHIVNIIEAAQRGDLEMIDNVELAPLFKWKIAFLYQDTVSPKILNIFSLDKLQEITGLSGRGYSYPQYYDEIMKSYDPKRVQNVAEFGRQIWRELDNTQEMDNTESSSMKICQSSLNTILYGPPGTGKTYTTINKALQIVAPDFYLENKDNREKLKARFDELLNNNRIGFVTFHQSFSYEDFVEGLKASTTEDKQISYDVEDGIFKSMCNSVSEKLLTNINEKRVLIIDEINRGNISNIFGELITLIEPSKRSGGSESLSVKLPYSKETFSVPSNLHIIGTMNTADKSLAQLDIALRRRFEFVEMMTNYELLKGISDIEGINVAKLVKTMNQRIELLYDREHTIGHSFFLPLLGNPSLQLLAEIFELQILPLLEEYFFEDWERVGQVLGDHLKDNHDLRFIVEQFGNSEIAELMGDDWEVQGIQPYCRNQEAFKNPQAYIGVYTR